MGLQALIACGMDLARTLALTQTWLDQSFERVRTLAGCCGARSAGALARLCFQGRGWVWVPRAAVHEHAEQLRMRARRPRRPGRARHGLCGRAHGGQLRFPADARGLRAPRRPQRPRRAHGRGGHALRRRRCWCARAAGLGPAGGMAASGRCLTCALSLQPALIRSCCLRRAAPACALLRPCRAPGRRSTARPRPAHAPAAITRPPPRANQLRRVANVMRAAGNPIPAWMLRLEQAPTVARQRDRDRRKRRAARAGPAADAA